MREAAPACRGSGTPHPAGGAFGLMPVGGRERRLVCVDHKDRQQLGRLCLAGVEAEGVVRTRILRPSLAYLVGAGRLAIDRVADPAFEDICENEASRRMTGRGNLAAWREIDDGRLQRLSRNIGKNSRKAWLRSYAPGRSRYLMSRRVRRCDGEHGRHGKMNNFEHDHSFLLFSSLVDGGRREGSFTSSTVLRRLEAERQLDPISPRLAECHRGEAERCIVEGLADRKSTRLNSSH